MTYFVEGADRVMKVLDCFTAETPELRLTDLRILHWECELGRPGLGQKALEYARRLADLYSADVADTIRVQYGGSVNGANAANMTSYQKVSLADVPGASLGRTG